MTDLLNLGGFKFKARINAQESISKTYTWRWSELQRFGRGSVLQATGKDSDTWAISGVIYPQYAGREGLSTMEELIKLGDSGKDHLLVDRSGNNYGRWAITSISETARHFTRDNLPRKIEFTINLKRNYR